MKIITLLLLLGLVGCSDANRILTGSNKSEPVEEIYKPPIQRYQIVAGEYFSITQEGNRVRTPTLLKIDTQTGESWRLNDLKYATVWVQIAHVGAPKETNP